MAEIEKPIANPFQAPPGPVVLTTRVRVDASATHIVRIIVYEGSFWPLHGTELWRKDVTAWLGQDWTTIQVTHPSVEGTIDRRDVKVEVYDTNFNFLVIEREWDDVFYVIPIGVEPDLKVLTYQILGESQGGSISFEPAPLDALGHYVKGTVVTLAATANPGFVFVKWRGEVDEPLSTNLTNTTTMSENRLVKAEFGLTVIDGLFPLEVDITPVGAGWVSTDPPPLDMANRFINGTIGRYAEGVRVLVTAHANTGFVFDHWSDEIQGGVSYNQIEWVAGVMDESRTVKAHFRTVVDEEEPPDIRTFTHVALSAGIFLGLENAIWVQMTAAEITHYQDSLAGLQPGEVREVGVPIPPPEEEPPAKGLGWGWIAVIGVAALALIPRKKK